MPDKKFKVTIEMSVNAPGLSEPDIDHIKMRIAERAKNLEHWNYWFSTTVTGIKIEEA